jgi:hypothetical protein
MSPPSTSQAHERTNLLDPEVMLSISPTNRGVMLPEGEKAREKIVAGSMPRRRSVTLAQFVVDYTRIRIPSRPAAF